MIFNTVFAGKSGGVFLDVVTAASLPSAVVDNQIVVITSTTPSTIYVSTNEPTSPANGDVWVVVATGDYGINLSEESPFFDLKFAMAWQYVNGVKNSLDGYVGVSGVWQRFAYAFPASGTPIASWNWEQIVALANSGENAEDYFAVGDEKAITLSTGEAVAAVIGDFYHNTISNSGGKKAAIAFTLKSCLATQYAMNPTMTNVGGWDGSNMRKTHMVTILNTFPAELRASGAIKYVDVEASGGGTSKELKISSDRLRIHSVKELNLTGNYQVAEGTPYAYYTSGNRGKGKKYWTRTAYTANSDSFWTVATSGSLTDQYIGGNYEYGVALCFDI